MADPQWYAATQKEVAQFCGVGLPTVKAWVWLPDAHVQLASGKWVYDLSLVHQIKYARIEQAPQNRRTRCDGYAVTYQDKKDREQAWKMRYERLEVQNKYIAKVYVQNALMRWAVAFPGPLRELVSFMVSLVPGSQKAKVKKEGLEAVARCMSKVRDLATSYGAELPGLETSRDDASTSERKAVTGCSGEG